MVPSPDPVSVSITVATAIVALGAKLFGQGRREADVVVQTQNDLGRQLDVISAALHDTVPDSLDQLVSWRDQITKLGNDFYNFTLGFSRAGQGARDTILGDLINGEWVPTEQKKGWLTRLLHTVIRKIEEVIGMQPQMGAFDWNRLLDVGVSIADRVLQGPTGYYPPVIQPVPQPAPVFQGLSDLEKWLPALAIGGVLLVAVLATRK